MRSKITNVINHMLMHDKGILQMQKKNIFVFYSGFILKNIYIKCNSILDSENFQMISNLFSVVYSRLDDHFLSYSYTLITM